MTERFEEMFSDFLERYEYDDAQRALFTVVRAAFLAGWRAAGGEAPQAQKVFELIEGGHSPSDEKP